MIGFQLAQLYGAVPESQRLAFPQGGVTARSELLYEFDVRFVVQIEPIEPADFDERLEAEEVGSSYLAAR